MTNLNNAKKQFVAPMLIEYGKFEELTKGNADGNFTDAEFPDDTPKNQLTFS